MYSVISFNPLSVVPVDAVDGPTIPPFLASLLFTLAKRYILFSSDLISLTSCADCLNSDARSLKSATSLSLASLLSALLSNLLAFRSALRSIRSAFLVLDPASILSPAISLCRIGCFLQKHMAMYYNTFQKIYRFSQSVLLQDRNLSTGRHRCLFQALPLSPDP
ncbi:hypothetical protein JCM19294_1518 [Nonlabens tegetincola]|uniref:Uncharacterized protein n=1 Tax=Nonlabens tegetincola TaxID=323273 RepID=A0A090Q5E9_9FLAO|nr:hypothetical protein JCM19294_1518 [Nonlabens tegetincola]